MRYSSIAGAGLCLLVAAQLGCGPGTQKAQGPSDEEQVRATFTTLQGALKAHDTEKVWELLDSTSQADAETAAKAWKEAYTKADEAKVKKDLGISPKELSELTGKSFLKTEAFYEKEIKELMGAKKLESVKIEGDRATVEYFDKEEGGSTDKQTFFRQDGKWKLRWKMEKPRD